MTEQSYREALERLVEAIENRRDWIWPDQAFKAALDDARALVKAAKDKAAELVRMHHIRETENPYMKSASGGTGAQPGLPKDCSEVGSKFALSGNELLQTTDGLVWAKEFCRITGFSDEAWALAWFCNAIMVGFDEANRRRDKAEQDKLNAHTAATSSPSGSGDHPATGTSLPGMSNRPCSRYELNDNINGWDYCVCGWKLIDHDTAVAASRPEEPPAERKPFRLNVTKEWCERMAKIEEECGDFSVGGAMTSGVTTTERPTLLTMTAKDWQFAEGHGRLATSTERQLVTEVCAQTSALEAMTQERDEWRALASVHVGTIEAKDAEIARAVEVASVFQVGGELHKIAKLPLGSSTVVEGMRWLLNEREQRESALVAFRAWLVEAQEKTSVMSPTKALAQFDQAIAERR